MKKGFILSVLLLVCLAAKAQDGRIIYQEFDPPLILEKDHTSTYPTKIILIDLDLDSVYDYKLQVEFAKGGYAFTESTYSNTQLRGANFNDSISSYAGGWGYVHDIWPNDNGDFDDEKVALRKVIDGEYYYGWLHRKGHIDSSFPFYMWMTIDKVAFCTVPNYPLLWGQTSMTAIEEDTESHALATIHPNPTTGIVRIDGEKAIEIQVLNALGQLVKTIQNTNEVNLHGLPQGIYLLRVALEDGTVFTDKVVKE